MNRYFVLLLALALPLGANAFQDKVLYLKGVTITATRSATRLCGVDFLITVSDGDQHLVKIDYSYNGTFNDNPLNQNLQYFLKGTRSDKINISVGKSTLEGNLARVAAREFPDNSLVCREAWAFHFTASEYNASQNQRNYQDELKRKEQARIDEINRRKAEQAEHERWIQQQLVNQKKAQVQAKYDALTNYRRSTPESSGCILNDLDDIARCNQSIARIREDRLREEASAIEAQNLLEAQKIAAAKQAAQFKEADALYERTRADPCAAAAENARRMSQLQQQAQQYHWSPRQLADAQAQWKQAQAAHEASCAAAKQAQNVSPQTPTGQSQPQQTPEQQKVQILLDLVKQLGLFK